MFFSCSPTKVNYFSKSKIKKYDMVNIAIAEDLSKMPALLEATPLT